MVKHYYDYWFVFKLPLSINLETLIVDNYQFAMRLTQDESQCDQQKFQKHITTLPTQK